MSTKTLNQNNHHDEHHNDDSKTIFGFWVYIMSDCILFASIFATYAVLHNNVYGGPDAKELFSMPFVLIEKRKSEKIT